MQLLNCLHGETPIILFLTTPSSHGLRASLPTYARSSMRPQSSPGGAARGLRAGCARSELHCIVLC